MPWRLARQVEPSTGVLHWPSSDGGEPAAKEQPQEARSVQCECCGMAEECTPTYIGRVRERFGGRWVCGLCAEAVEERRRRRRSAGDDDVAGAVDAHAALCHRFNSTVRLNPKLSLASSMRDIARKSCLHRATGATSGAAPPLLPSGAGACGGDGDVGPNISRTTSCALPYV